MALDIVSIFLACFAPSLAWLAYWVYRNRLSTGHPLTRDLRPALPFFLAGLLSGPLALGLYDLIQLSPFYMQLTSMQGIPSLTRFTYCVVAIGPIEEMSKFIVAWSSLKLLGKHVDQRLGGPVYSAAAALGFATIENWYYMIDINKVIWYRPLILPFNHVLFSSFWGVGLALDYARPKDGHWWLLASLVLSFVYHGLYDYVLLAEDLPHYLVLPLILVLWIWLMLAVPRLRETTQVGPMEGKS